MPYPGFPTGVENMGAVPPSPPLQNLMGQLESIHGGSMERLKMLSKNTFEGVHLVAKLTATSLQLVNLLKMNFFTHWKGTSHFNGGPSFFSVCEGGGVRGRWSRPWETSILMGMFSMHTRNIYILFLSSPLFPFVGNCPRRWWYSILKFIVP